MVAKRKSTKQKATFKQGNILWKKDKDSGSKSSDADSSSSSLNGIAYNNDSCASCHSSDLHLSYSADPHSSHSTDIHSSDSISISRPDKSIYDEALNTEFFFLSCLNIQPPSLTLIQRKVSKICDKMLSLNEKSMVENQLFVKNVDDMLGHDQFIDVETDTSYNNRPQAGGEAGTQSFTPLVELNTTKKLTIALDEHGKTG
ncbi:uncharacterized protein LOC127706643 [Mytilus californianus]|uniref:uncharacterized protein LOC127706643 n=1 Tax=Mytilus californianus TaxID=6549 RepID=UPI002245FDE5|nr:uncharacterized protein LOC127706643 [Mytilus californianus]